MEVPPLSQDHLPCYHSGSASLISGPSQMLPQWKCLPYLRTISAATTVEVPPLSQDHLPYLRTISPATTVEVPPLSQDHLRCYHSGSASLISGPSPLLPQWKCLPYLRTNLPCYHSGSASLISGPSSLLPQWKCHKSGQV